MSSTEVFRDAYLRMHKICPIQKGDSVIVQRNPDNEEYDWANGLGLSDRADRSKSLTGQVCIVYSKTDRAYQVSIPGGIVGLYSAYLVPFFVLTPTEPTWFKLQCHKAQVQEDGSLQVCNNEGESVLSLPYKSIEEIYQACKSKHDTYVPF